MTIKEEKETLKEITRGCIKEPLQQTYFTLGIDNVNNYAEIAKAFPVICLSKLPLDSLTPELQSAFRDQHPGAFPSPTAPSVSIEIDPTSDPRLTLNGSALKLDSITIDPASNSRLTVGAAGLNLDSITQAEIQLAQQSQINALATKFVVTTCAPAGSSRAQVDCCIHKHTTAEIVETVNAAGTISAIDPFVGIDCNNW